MILDTHFVDFTTCLLTSDHPIVGFTTCFWTSSRPVINISTRFTTLDSENRALARVLATQLRSRSCFGRATYVLKRNLWGSVDIGHFELFFRLAVL